MKKNKILKTLLLSATLILSAGLFAGCSADKKETAKAAEQSSEKTKITIATSANPRPFTYVDDKDEITGYDIEVAKAVFAKLPQYEIKFEVTEFPSVLAGLDSGIYQVGANNFALNKERQEKYIYSDAIFQNQYVIAVPEDNTDIKSFADLKGKKAEVTAGVNYTTALEKFNEKNSDNPVNLIYTETELLPILQNVENGKTDFNLIDAAMLKIFEEKFGVKLKAVPLSPEDSALISESNYSYFLISKGVKGEQLTQDINKALKEVIADGTITEISKKFFGSDFAPKLK